MSKRFVNKTVLVTGAGGGLGRALAIGFAREGARLVLTDVDQPKLSETADILNRSGGECSTHVVDLSNEAATQAFGAKICELHPTLDVLYNNAGIAYGEINLGFEKTSLEKWLRFITINSLSPLILAQALRPSLGAAKGAIINQSSMASNVPANPYGVTKAALNAITYGMAQSFAPDGVRVNAIEPGIMETPANKASLPDETYARIQGMQLLPLHGTAQDIVNLALFLASDEARFITCEIISCDAGNRLRGWRY